MRVSGPRRPYFAQRMNYPIYSYPPHVIAGLIRDLILMRHRIFKEDSVDCISRLSPPLKIYGKENIPAGGGYTITANHYHRRGFAAQWLAIAISSVINLNVHWIITGELTFPGKWFAPLGAAASRLILKRAAHVYGFTTMPPMPPRPCDLNARAASVRAVLKYAQNTKDGIIGLAPEGGDQMDGRLRMPAPGAGRFAL